MIRKFALVTASIVTTEGSKQALVNNIGVPNMRMLPGAIRDDVYTSPMFPKPHERSKVVLCAT